jgi:hypothetical protein
MSALCRGIVRTQESLLAVDSEIVLAHVDATDLYTTKDESLAEEVELRQHIVFLALDLITGRVDEEHPLFSFLAKSGFSANELDWFRQHAVSLDVLGINMYPMFTLKEAVRTKSGLRMRMPYATSELVEQLAEMYWQRYQRPIMITETASVGPVNRRIKWLNDSVSAVKRLRERGVPVVGYTWWPMFALVGWAYRQNVRPFSDYVLQMGLWNLDTNNVDDLRRVSTPVVDAYKVMIAGGNRSVGALSSVGAR